MNEEQNANAGRISKKELLEQTGISYGQLYRWKRERLIPEEWFIKQSAFTGQETYFPRELVLARVQAILNMKDSHSLDEMARFFSPDPQSTIAASELESFAALDCGLLELLQKDNDAKDSYETGEVVFLTALSKFIGSNGLASQEAAVLVEDFLSGAGSKVTPASKCVLFRNKKGDGSVHIVCCNGEGAPLFDSGIEVIGMLALQEAAEAFGSYLAER